MLRILCYPARCSICDGEITIENGLRQHRGRLVGECDRTPKEHVLSFDFNTGKSYRI